jgi:hypothetical protein
VPRVVFLCVKKSKAFSRADDEEYAAQKENLDAPGK